MYGAILGDIVGSRFEYNNNKSKEFRLFGPDSTFTDDTVLTIAVMDFLLKVKKENNSFNNKNLVGIFVKYAREYSSLPFGNRFLDWVSSKYHEPYGSYGNGAAMRISPIAYIAKDIEEVKELSKAITEVTHNDKEGLKGAECLSTCIFKLLMGDSKENIKKYVEENYYSLNFNYKQLVKNYEFDATCQGSIPQAIYCFLISTSFEDALRTAVSIGGDSDTIADMTGSLAEAYYGVSEELKNETHRYLDENLDEIFEEFLTFAKYDERMQRKKSML